MAKKITYLNIDALVEEPIVVKIKGVDYYIPEIPLKKYLALAKLQDINEDQPEEQFIALQKLLIELIPRLTIDVVEELTMNQVNALMNFITDRAVDQEEINKIEDSIEVKDEQGN